MAASPVIRLSLPLPPPSDANSRGHWRIGHRKKKEYWDNLGLLLDLNLITQPPSEPVGPAYAEVDLYLHNFMDDDNAANRMKPLWDWLVAAGYLVNDSRKWLRQEGFPTQTIDRTRPRVELTIRKDRGRK